MTTIEKYPTPSAANIIQRLFTHAKDSMSKEELQWIIESVSNCEEENRLISDTINLLATVDCHSNEIVLPMLGLAERNKTVAAMSRIIAEAAEELESRGGAA